MIPANQLTNAQYHATYAISSSDVKLVYRMRCVIPMAALTECDHDYTAEVDFKTFCYIAREKFGC